MDVQALADAMIETVPFARTLGVRFVAVDPEGDGVRAVVEMPDAPGLHNHVGGPHAGALFALGETASGAAVMAAFGDQLARAVPLAVRAEIGYRKLAMGTVRATARLSGAAARVVAELDAGGRPEFAVPVELSTVDGVVTAEMLVVWTLRPNRPAR
jgi:acyl-coenzyme A thioesterase PaaI-like protein